jgi:ribonuclease HII
VPPPRAALDPRRPTLTEERRLWKAGHEHVAGLDEVGRGAWAGPVTVGVALVRPGVRRNSMPRWLRDSKLLAEDRREEIFEEVGSWCAAWGVGHADAAECDRFGMTAALRLASLRALEELGSTPDALIVDGPYDLLQERVAVQAELPLGLDPAVGRRAELRTGGPLPVPDVTVPAVVVPVIDGDARCAAVAAASVLAKVVRDRLMRADAPHYPPYDFERNKGYPSPAHQMALRGYGPSAIHRRSWAFVDGLPWG